MSRDRNVVAKLVCWACDDRQGLVVADVIARPAASKHVFMHELDPPLNPAGLCPNCGGELARREVA